MAQTRAGSKALRQILGFVVALAGYSPTPAEEMDGVYPAQRVSEPKSQAPHKGTHDFRLISEKQTSFIKDLIEKKGKTLDELDEYIWSKKAKKLSELSWLEASALITELSQKPKAGSMEYFKEKVERMEQDVTDSDLDEIAKNI